MKKYLGFLFLLNLSCSNTPSIKSNNNIVLINSVIENLEWTLKKKTCPSYIDTPVESSKIIIKNDTLMYFTDSKLIYFDKFISTKDSIMWHAKKIPLYSFKLKVEDRFIKTADTLTYFSYYPEGCILFFSK